MIPRSAIIACFLLVAVPPAGAQPSASRAQELYDQGRALMAAGKVAESCAAFEQSQQPEPAVTTLIALATCRERLGQLATARALFREAEQQTRAASDATAAQLHQIARERADKLEPRVSKLTIRVSEGSTLEGLEILRDQERVPAEAWNRALPVDGGTYTITARAPGAKEWSTQVTLAAEAEAKTVEVPELGNAARNPGGRSEASLSGQPSQPSGRRGLALPLAVGAGAVALLGGALGFSLWGDAIYDDAKAEMTDQARRDALYDSANRKRYAAQSLAGVGVAGAGVAVWLYLRQRGARAEPSRRTARVMIAPTASSIGVIGRF